MNWIEETNNKTGGPQRQWSRRRWLSLTTTAVAGILAPRSVPTFGGIFVNGPWPGIAIVRRGRLSVYGRSSLDIATQALLRSRQMRDVTGHDGLWRLSIPPPQGVAADVNAASRLARGATSPGSSSHVTLAPFLAGMNYPSWDRTGWLAAESDVSLRQLRQLGAGAVALVIPIYQDTFQSVEVSIDPAVSPSDDAIRHATYVAHSLRMHVLLKPLLLVRDSGKPTPNGPSWRGAITPADWAQWFASYGRVLEHYAKLATELKVFGLVIGSEMKSTAKQTDLWRWLIDLVHGFFNGPQIYCANWDEYTEVEFWDRLPFLGIDAYPPLTTGQSPPTTASLLAGWQRWLTGIRSWQSSWRKPLFIGEVGFLSSSTSVNEPWRYNQEAVPDLNLQRSAYKATIEAFRDWPELAGMLWWNWEINPNAGGRDDTGYTPQNKPALDVLQQWFNEERSST